MSDAKVTWGFRAAAAVLLAVASVGCSSDDAAPASAGVVEGPPARAVGGFDATIPATVVAPGEDLYPCWVLPLEVRGPSRFVNAAVMRTNLGLHHGNVTTRPKTGEGVRPCEGGNRLGEASDVLAGGAVLFGSSTQFVGDEWRHFPEDMAYRVKDGFEIVARMHYLNPTPEPVTVETRYEWYTIAEADVRTELGPLFWQIKGFELPERTDTTIGVDCLLPEAMYLVDAMPHMHARGTGFVAKHLGGALDGQVFLDSPGYQPDGAIQQFTPAIDLSRGDGLSFACSWRNDEDRVIEDGASGDDEMCMLFGYAYPATNAFTLTASPNGTCFSVKPPDPAGQ